MDAVILKPYNQWMKGSATIFGKVNCEDYSAELAASSEINEVTTYTANEAWALGMKDGEMESFNLPWGYKLTLFDSDGMTGNSIDFYGR